jgi:hypothetical protein
LSAATRLQQSGRQIFRRAARARPCHQAARSIDPMWNLDSGNFGRSVRAPAAFWRRPPQLSQDGHHPFSNP